MRFFAALVHSLLFVMLFPHATSLFPFPVSSFSSAISSNRSGRHPHSLRLFRTVGHKGLLLSGICVHSSWGLQTVVLRLSCGLFVSAVQGRGVGERTVLPNVRGMLIALTTVFYLAISPSPFQSDGRCVGQLSARQSSVVMLFLSRMNGSSSVRTKLISVAIVP